MVSDLYISHPIAYFDCKCKSDISSARGRAGGGEFSDISLLAEFNLFSMTNERYCRLYFGILELSLQLCDFVQVMHSVATDLLI